MTPRHAIHDSDSAVDLAVASVHADTHSRITPNGAGAMSAPVDASYNTIASSQDTDDYGWDNDIADAAALESLLADAETLKSGSILATSSYHGIARRTAVSRESQLDAAFTLSSSSELKTPNNQPPHDAGGGDIILPDALPVAEDNSPGRIRFETEPEGAEGKDIAQLRPEDDPRSPLERFRTPPKKPLSVTDLVSPSWCELQYLYSLSRYGRVKRTAAMKRGSEVHKVLEEEVHQTVPVDVQTREDHWGLRMWNIIQGLRTLRTTGMTRELELWGTVGGQVVNGIIDELSFTCSDPEMERGLRSSEGKAAAKKGAAAEVAPDQMTISEYFGSKDSTHNLAARMQVKEKKKVYLTDVKTRARPSVPQGSQLRPTKMQLMTYRKLLSNLASNNVEASIIFQRYNLDPAALFSDGLISQLGSLELGLKHDGTEVVLDPVESDVDAAIEIITHNSLEKLWMLMVQEFQVTFPYGDESISKVLRAEFRQSSTGEVIGAKTFIHKEADIQSYLEDEISWWKGQRPTKGVDIEEAFKCGICEFAENCSWRIGKVEEAVQKSRARKGSRSASAG